jgi:hypothetical protein
LSTLEKPEFDIELSVNWLPTGMELTTWVSSESERLDKYVQLYVVVFETSVTAYTGGNGDTEFRNVVLDMLPSPTGVLLGNRWRKGSMDERTFTWTYPSYVEDVDELAVAVFVQDRGTGQILQAVVDYKDKTVAVPPSEILPSSMHIYPNPAHDRVYVNLGERISRAGRIEILDMGGKVVHEEALSAGYQIVGMDISYLSKGIYILRWVEGEQVRGVNKLVKTR